MAHRTSSRVHIHEYGEMRITTPSVIVGLPEVGLVGSIAASYLIQKLGLPEIGYVESELEPPVIIVQKGEPKHPIRMFGMGNLVIFLSEIPLSPKFAYELSEEIVNWCEEKQCKMLIGTTGIPSAERMEMQRTPRVLGISNQKEFLPSLKSIGVLPFDEGLVVGTYALLLKSCLAHNQPNITLFAEAHVNFPDPGAAAAIIDALRPLLSIDVDVKPLIEESEQIRVKSRELMKRTQQSMQEMSHAAPGVYA